MRYKSRILAVILVLAMILTQSSVVFAAQGGPVQKTAAAETLNGSGRSDESIDAEAAAGDEAVSGGADSAATDGGSGTASEGSPENSGTTAGTDAAPDDQGAADGSDEVPDESGTADKTDTGETAGGSGEDLDAGGTADEADAGAAEEETTGGDALPDSEEDGLKEAADSSWTAADFTYTDYSQRLYGCDYSRDFTISGKAVSGFSESGLEKLQTNTDLVLPAKDTEGNTLVGVAPHAFHDKGLTSVTFPTGMLVDYVDTVTGYRITKRGNYIIAENAFSNNKLTSVTLPDGVIAVMSYAFNQNQLTRVSLPKTIWWVETMSFSNNRIEQVGFPETTWFMFEMHGMAFAQNKIKSVRLPDYTAVVNKFTFMLNPGMEPLPAEAAEDTSISEAARNNSGVVYMYTDNIELQTLDRIHHIDKTTKSTKSWFQKLIVNDGSQPSNPDENAWNIKDFIVEGTVVKGLSESGIAKRKVNKDLVIPDYNAQADLITEIADGPAEAGGLFATAEEKFDSVTLPSSLKKIGANAFREAGLKDVAFPPELTEIGDFAFLMNDLTSVILPDTLTKLGNGAFATNPKIGRINLSKNLTEIPASAFGCSDNKNWMTDLTELTIPEGVTKIGARAFAGNNITDIVIPKGVTEIGPYAFSTKNYLLKEDKDCTLTLPDSLVTIGERAFRNKKIAEVTLPPTVLSLPEKVFERVMSVDGSSQNYDLVTKVFVSNYDQYRSLDPFYFPASAFHKLILTDATVWTADDFTYGDMELDGLGICRATDTQDKLTGPIHIVTGFSEEGLNKLETNKDLVIPSEDSDGLKIQGVGASAFTRKGLTSVTFPEGVMRDNEGLWDENVDERGDFYIATSAFSYNKLTTLDLPEGIFYIGGTAFRSNALTYVSFPSTIQMIASTAFGSNEISSVKFTKTTDFPLNIDNMAFAINKIRSVQLPDKTEKVTKWAFFQNTGMEPVTTGTANEKKGGIVYMYVNEPGAYIDDVTKETSNVQKLFADQEIPADQAPWNAEDFTFSESGDTITGLTDSGKAKIKVNPALILPDKGPVSGTMAPDGDETDEGGEQTPDGDGTGESGEQTPDGQEVSVQTADVTAIGNGTAGTAGKEQIGTFGILLTEDGVKTPYVPTSVKFPAKLTKIGDFAFSAYINTATGETAGLTDVTFPNTLKEIGQAAFQNAPLKKIILPDSVRTLGTGAFTGTICASEIKLSEGLTEIPNSAFTKTNNSVRLTDMAEVKELIVPEGVTAIGNHAFAGNRVGELTLPESLKTIGTYAFLNHAMEAIRIPGSVTKIGNKAFAVSNELLTVKAENLELLPGFNGEIGRNAFEGLGLTDAAVPLSFTISGENPDMEAFTGNPGYNGSGTVRLLTSVQENVDTWEAIEDKSDYTWTVAYDKFAGTGWAAGDFTYSEDGSTLTGFSESGLEKLMADHDVILPDTAPDGTPITVIGEEAFAAAEDEVDVGKYDYSSENGMTSVVLPKDLEKIGDRAFEFNNLKEIDLEGAEKLTEIGVSAFHGNKLLRVSIPDTVTALGEGAFSANSIVSLKLSRNVTVIPQGAFSMNIRLSRIEIPDTVTEIGEMAFAGARLTSLEIPASVTKIGKKAFHLHVMTKLTVPGTVKEIGESAFEGTYKDQTLKELVLGEGIESIGRYAFKEGLLTTVDLPSSLKEMGEEPFLNNTGTDTNNVVLLYTKNFDHLAFNEGAVSHLVVISEEGKVWESSDFTFDGSGTTVTGFTEKGISKLALNPNVVIPDKGPAAPEEEEEPAEPGEGEEEPAAPAVTAIADGAFKGYPIEALTLPEGLETIGAEAFKNTLIAEIAIPSTVTEIKESAFAIDDDSLEPMLKTLSFGEEFNGVIADNAFGNQKIKESRIPATLEIEKVHYNAFADNPDIVILRTDSEEQDKAYKAIEDKWKYTYEVVLDGKERKYIELAGSTRYATAAALAKEAFPEAPYEVIIVKSTDFPDALSANAYAGAAHAPVLLSSLNGLSEDVKDLLKTTWGGKVVKATYIGGGFGDQIDKDLQACGIRTFESLAGADRYLTAEAVMKAGFKKGYFTDEAVIIATGQKAADALSVSPWSYRLHYPMLLATSKLELKETSKRLISEYGFKKVILLGNVADSCAAGIANTVRLEGKTRYETSLKIADYFINTEQAGGYQGTGFAMGYNKNFPDALAAGMVMGTLGAPVILARSDSEGEAVFTFAADELSDMTKYDTFYFIGAAAKGKENSSYDDIVKAIESKDGQETETPEGESA